MQHEHTSKNQDSTPAVGHSKHEKSMYNRFVLMAILMFFAMYFIMFSMVDRLENVIPNLNNFYMTLLMVSAMLLIEILIMRKMYPNKTYNFLIIGISVALGIFAWFGIRNQMNINDKEFVRGMIPHHAAAILMSEKANLSDPELIELQKNILKTQAQEIELMRRKLDEMNK